jgi:hypothetical protein
VGLARLAEDVRGDDAALVLADVGERPEAGDVADRPQALADAQLRVDRDAMGAGLDADGLEADAVDARAAARGDEQAVAAQLAAVAELEPSALPSGAGSRASTCSPRSASTTSPPSCCTACAISTPTGPPPSTSSRRGTAFMPVASRLVQAPSSSRKPGIGGTIGSAPLASTTCSAVYRLPSTSTTPVPASRPLPRSRSIPWPASQRSCPASEYSETMKSRQASPASTSICAVASASRAPCTASPGRNSVLDGMHAQ